MKICIAQTKPIRGNVSANIEAHIRFIELALTSNSEAILIFNTETEEIVSTMVTSNKANNKC